MDLFRQAFTIMVLGMTLVFVFLALVILAISLAARVIHRLEGPPREEGAAAAGDALARNRRVAAIAAALRHVREKD